MAGSPQDAVDRYLANRERPKPEPPVTKAQAAAAEAAGARRGDEMNRKLLLGRYRVHTDSVTVDPDTGEPIFGDAGDAVNQNKQDWSAYLGLFGLPADVLKEINSIFTKTPDITQATIRAQAYVRGTSWYTQTYPGIQEAIAKGIVKNEQEYRSRMNDFAQVYRQYTNRDVTASEYADHLREGVDVGTVARRFQGSALENVYGGDWQYAEGNFGEGRLTGEESQALGRQQAGLDSALGLRVQRRLQMANERIKTVFGGSLATSRLADPVNQQNRPDIGR